MQIEAAYWGEDLGSGYYFREEFDKTKIDGKLWEYDKAIVKDGVCAVKGSLKFTRALWGEKELVQAAVKMSKPIQKTKFPGLLHFSANGTIKDVPRCRVLLPNNALATLRWVDEKGNQQKWKNLTGAENWYVYGVLPTKKGANFYVKEGKEPFDPDNLPDAAFSVLFDSVSDDLFCYILPGWEGSKGGNAIEVDWLQIGNPKNINTFDFTAPDKDRDDNK